MNDISVFGAGAFGTALAISLARDGRKVSLVARTEIHAKTMARDRKNSSRLPGYTFPETLIPTYDVCDVAPICLVAVPMQKLSEYLPPLAAVLNGRNVVACCKGVDLATGSGPTATIAATCPGSVPSVLSGPGFAADIATGLPTALTIGAETEDIGVTLQAALSTANLRIYRTTDITGVELGGALKNVVAIAAGVAIGAGLGESARAALMTRGYAELNRFAQSTGAAPETLSGLSGFGDLVLTCTSEKSRNYSFGIALGQGRIQDQNRTVEGISTAKAVSVMAKTRNIDMPVTSVIAKLVDNQLSVGKAVEVLLSRPLTKE